MSVHVALSESAPALGALESHVEAFLANLHAAGYADRTLEKKRNVVQSFIRWTRDMEVAVEDLNESHVAAYFRRSQPRRKAQATRESAALRLFLRYLHLDGSALPPVATAEVPATEALLHCYADYLRSEQGLAENSICVYVPYIRDFLNERSAKCGCIALEECDAPAVHAFVIEHIRGRSSEYARLLGVALRSFFRFLYVLGRTPIDLSFAVPSVRRWRQATLPSFLSPEQVEQILSRTDRTTRCGRRDYAILLLLARLGLRASEVVGMELEDICWRSQELIVRGKAVMVNFAELRD